MNKYNKLKNQKCLDKDKNSPFNKLFQQINFNNINFNDFKSINNNE